MTLLRRVTSTLKVFPAIFFIFPACFSFVPFASADIEEIVVTARGIEESVRDIPVAISVVDEDRMNTFGIESFSDLEALTPQLVVARGGSGNGAAIGIRGIASATSSIGIESSVAIIIDGVYMPQARAINEGLMDVRQVAVLKGPQALYFGKNATAGVVSLMSNNPGDEFEASLRVNNEFETDDLTLEGVVSIPINEKIGIRLAAQVADMDKGWIKNNAGADTYTVTDIFTFQQTTFDNPAAELWFPKEEWTNIRLTVAGDLNDRFGYNFKASHSKFAQSASSGGGELFSCPTLNGVGHRAVAVDPQPAGRQTTLYEAIPQPAVDCTFNGARGINDVPPGVAASNNLLAQFGDGSLGEEYESYNYTLTLDYALDNVDLQTIINYHDAELGWVSDFDGGGVTSIFAGEFNTFEQFAVEARAITRFDSPVNFVLGGYYQSTDRSFNQDVIFAFIRWTGPIDDPNDEFTAYNKESETDGETWSVYGEVTWDITDRLQLTAGARYIEETKDSWFTQPFVNPAFTGLFIPYISSDLLTRAAADQKWDDLIPEVTLTYALSDNITIYGAYKEGFKSGGFSNSAILSNLSPPLVNGAVCISPRLGGTCTASPGDEIEFLDFVFDEETNKGGEIGIKASLFNGSVLADLTGFFYKFDDLQVDFFNDAQFAFVTSNAGGSETYGIELQLDWATPIEGLVVSGSLGWLESKFTDFDEFCYGGQTPADGCGPLQPGQTETDLRQNLAGNTRAGAPQISAHLVASYERSIGGNLVFGFTGNVQYKGDQELSNSIPGVIQDSYTTVSANIRLGTQDGRWQLALIGKNLTDEMAFRGAGDVPETGGNTGTAEGFRGDYSGGVIRPRQYELELTWRF